MENYTNISLKDFIKMTEPSHVFRDEIVLMEITGDNKKMLDFEHDTPIRFKAICITLVCEGEMNITLDYTPYRLTKNMMVDIVHQHIVQFFSVSPDFKAYRVFISRDFMEDTLGKEKPFPLEFVVSKRLNPVLELKEEEMGLLIEIVKKIKSKIIDKENIFQRNLIINKLSTFLMELGNIIYHKHKDVSFTPELTHKEEIIKQFFKLITQYCKDQHEVSFYAKELCITPEYLSRIMKKTTGKTVNKWIAHALIAEAKILLRNPEVTIQQIADILNFSDQSSFGKFFKRHRGITPLEYRNKNFHYL